MRCVLCGQSSGWLRRRCRTCGVLWKVWEAHRGDGMAAMLRAFGECGATRDQVERFLTAEAPGGGVTMRDRIATDMSNQLLGAMGQAPCQRADSTRKLRMLGAWRRLDERPEE